MVSVGVVSLLPCEEEAHVSQVQLPQLRATMLILTSVAFFFGLPLAAFGLIMQSKEVVDNVTVLSRLFNINREASAK